MTKPSKSRDQLGDLTRAQVEAELCRRKLPCFAQRYWPAITGMRLVRNYAIDALGAVLQAIGDGQLTRTLIAIPPGTGKTTELACYSAWRLARNAAWRSIRAMHGFDLVATESRRVRRVVESDEYSAMFPSVRLRDDESTIALWATTAGGAFIATGTDGALTGRRAHEVVIDDPLNALDRYSKSARDTLWAWFTESLSTRLDGELAPITVVAQRLDRDDLIGRLLEAGGWTMVELPAEFDPRRICVVRGFDGDEVWRDPRSVEGELLAPNVLPQAKLDALKVQIGAAAYATQFGQAPSDDSNATVKRAWWRFHHGALVAPTTPRPFGCDTSVAAVRTPDRFDRVVVSCDLTFGSTKGDYAVAQVWASVGAARFLLAQWRRRAGLLESVAAIRAFAAEHPGCKVLVEKAAHGAGAVEELTAAGVPGVIGVVPVGSKDQRLGLVSACIEAGNCHLPLGASWLADFVEELSGASKHDDQQDAAAYAIHELNTIDPAAEARRTAHHRNLLATCPISGDPVARCEWLMTELLRYGPEYALQPADIERWRLKVPRVAEPTPTSTTTAIAPVPAPSVPTTALAHEMPGERLVPRDPDGERASAIRRRLGEQTLAMHAQAERDAQMRVQHNATMEALAAREAAGEKLSDGLADTLRRWQRLRREGRA